MRIFITILLLGFSMPILAQAYPPAYLCKKKLHGVRPWVCGKWRYRCLRAVTTDGCSVPKKSRKLLKIYNIQFRKACEAHDVCYVLGPSKKRCDSDFLKAMVRTCGPRGFESKPCLLMAEAYYAEVATAKRHKKAFRDDQKWKYRKSGKKVYCVKF